ncbi:MAG: hypothetical protein OXR67_10165 [Chloroflexota bacterium]|nr:hypothetical protein [Chloroflexota bacterium]
MTAAAAIIVILVGIFWVVSSSAANQESTVSAEVTEPDRVQPRPTATPAPTPTPSIETPAGTAQAPDFRGIVQWLNSEPLTMEEQRGKVVLIDFWTYS